MSDSRFVDNPAFWPAIEAMVARAVEDKAGAIEEKGEERARTAGGHQVGSLRSEPARRDAEGIFATVRIEKGLGTIFNPGAPNRKLLGNGRYRAGTNRGSIKAIRFFESSIEDELAEGLDLLKYL